MLQPTHRPPPVAAATASRHQPSRSPRLRPASAISFCSSSSVSADVITHPPAPSATPPARRPRSTGRPRRPARRGGRVRRRRPRRRSSSVARLRRASERRASRARAVVCKWAWVPRAASSSCSSAATMSRASRRRIRAAFACSSRPAFSSSLALASHRSISPRRAVEFAFEPGDGPGGGGDRAGGPGAALLHLRDDFGQRAARVVGLRQEVRERTGDDVRQAAEIGHARLPRTRS